MKYPTHNMLFKLGNHYKDSHKKINTVASLYLWPRFNVVMIQVYSNTLTNHHTKFDLDHNCSLIIRLWCICHHDGYINVGDECWWRMLETKCVGDNWDESDVYGHFRHQHSKYISYNITKIEILSPTPENCNQHMQVTNIH